ncbi:MAG: ABC-2 type transport system permease protein [Porticoccus sp.]|jgi:ABC-2 type transport system permease protein
MKEILALWMARNREYYRDKGSLFWSFVATPFIVIVLAVAFSSESQAIFRAGLLVTKNTPQTNIFSGEPAIQLIEYTNQQEALRRIQFHQLDILITTEASPHYWVNTESAKGRLLEKLLITDATKSWQREEIKGQSIRYIDWVIPGILAMNMMFSGLWGIGYVIVRYRKNGVLKRLKATPLRAWQFLASQGLSRLFIMLSVTILVFVACDIFLDFMMIGSYLLLLLVAMVGNLAIISMSLLMATRTSSEELANGLLNLISVPMLLLSELWFSLDDAPQWLQDFSLMLPLTHLVKAARGVMLEGAGFTDIAPQLGILILMTLFFVTLAGTLFRWYND